MLISTIISEKGGNVVTITEDRSVSDAVRLLAEHGIGAVVVSSDGRRVDGILSERDIVRRLVDDPDTLHRTVGDLMTRDVFTCTRDDVVLKIMVTMSEHRFRHMPVVDASGNLTAIVSIGDVVKCRMSELEEQWRQLQEYMASGR
mgnify:CR=1 FL=1